MLSGALTLEVAVDAVNEGRVHHVLRKPCPSSDVLDAVDRACRASVAARAAAALDGPPSLAGVTGLEALTRREQDVLGLVLTGLRVPQVARALHVSPHTVKNHLRRLFDKLGVRSQAELVERFRQPQLAARNDALRVRRGGGGGATFIPERGPASGSRPVEVKP